MTDRGMTPAVLSALGSSTPIVVHLLEVDFNPPTVFLTDAAVNITYGIHTYLASHFLTFSDIEETRELLVNKCTIGLSGVDQQVIALLMQDSYVGRPARIYTAILAADLTVVAEPCLVMDGRLDAPVIATDPENGTCEASVDVVSRWSPLARPSGRRTNDAEQQQYFPGDLGFNQVSDDLEVVVWGELGHYTRRFRERWLEP